MLVIRQVLINRTNPTHHTEFYQHPYQGLSQQVIDLVMREGVSEVVIRGDGWTATYTRHEMRDYNDPMRRLREAMTGG